MNNPYTAKKRTRKGSRRSLQSRTRSTGDLGTPLKCSKKSGGRHVAFRFDRIETPNTECGQEEGDMESARAKTNQAEEWDGLVQQWEDLGVNTQILLREDYLKRLKDKCLPFIDQPDDVELSENEVEGIADLIDLLRQVTLTLIENVQEYSENNFNQPFLWKGRNCLLSIPSDLDFLEHLPLVKESFGINSAKRNPFLLAMPIPLPGQEIGQVDFVLGKNPAPNTRFVWVLSHRGRIQSCIEVLLREEVKHGVVPTSCSAVVWKELEELSDKAQAREKQFQQIERKMIPKLSKIVTGINTIHCFRRNDKDGDGMLFYGEFWKAMKTLNLISLASEPEREWMTCKVDPTQSGWISYNAFNKLCEWAVGERKKQAPRMKRKSQGVGQEEPLYEQLSDQQLAIQLSLDGQLLEGARLASLVFGPDKVRQVVKEVMTKQVNEFQVQIDKNKRRQNKLQNELAHIRQEIGSQNPEKEFAAREYEKNILASLQPLNQRCVDNPGSPSRAHVEYSKMNAARFEQLIHDLSSWENDLETAIEVLREEEAKITKLQQNTADKFVRLGEKLQNIAEEAVMKRLEREESARVAEERAMQEIIEKEKRMKEAQEWREAQRREKKAKARAEAELKRIAAVKIQAHLRRRLAENLVEGLQIRRRQLMNMLADSLYFNQNDQRLHQRPTPMVIIGGSDAHTVTVSQMLGDILQGGYWSVLCINPENPVQPGMIKHCLCSSPGLIIRCDDGPVTEGFLVAIRACLQQASTGIPLTVLLQPSLPLKKRPRNAGDPFVPMAASALNEILLHPPDHILLEMENVAQSILGDTAATTIPMNVERIVFQIAFALSLLLDGHLLDLEDRDSIHDHAYEFFSNPRRLLGRMLCVDAQSLQQKFIEDTKNAPSTFGYLENLMNETNRTKECNLHVWPALCLLLDWIALQAAFISSPMGVVSLGKTDKTGVDLVHEFDGSLEQVQRTVDSIVQVSMCELRVYQNIPPNSDRLLELLHSSDETGRRSRGDTDSVVSLFRYGSERVLARVMMRGLSRVLYRILTLDQLATTLNVQVSRKQDDLQAHQLISHLRFSTKSKISRRIHVPCDIFKYDPEKPRDLVDSNAIVPVCKEGVIYWLYVNGKRLQARSLSTRAPYNEYRGSSVAPSELLPISLPPRAHHRSKYEAGYYASVTHHILQVISTDTSTATITFNT